MLLKWQVPDFVQCDMSDYEEIIQLNKIINEF